MELLKFFTRPPLVCSALPAGKYEFDHILENHPVHGRRQYKGQVQLLAEPWAEQVVTLFRTLSLEGNGETQIIPQELLIYSYLIPIIQDVEKFREELISSSTRKRDTSGGFTPYPGWGLKTKAWNCRDTSICESWLIDLYCDDEIVSKVYKLHRNP
ncbi:MAG: hypothetical protein KAT26_02405 [Marinosulfonomonas sp.]|nr:hypothetical protein [Marinosulfonomonas sp.]